jgi:hypothetical protein
MFLIEFSEGQFIDGERINYVWITNSKVKFSISGDNETLFIVDKVNEKPFLNQLQVLNANITDVAGRHHHINKPDTKY